MSTAGYLCRYCRQPSDTSGVSCPHCGAPIDVRAMVSASGWTRQPPIKDLTRIQIGRSAVQIVGRQVPVAEFTLVDDDWIYFAHHVLLWCQSNARLQAMALGGAWKRSRAGLPVIMLQGAGPGKIGLADNDAGEIVALPLQGDQSVVVREHRLFAATGSVGYDWQGSPIWFETVTDGEAETHHPLGYFEDRFCARSGPGLLLLHCPGNAFVRDLAPGESMLIRPAALLYRDVTVDAHLHFEYPQASVGTQVLGLATNLAGGLAGGLARNIAGEMLGGFLRKKISRALPVYSVRDTWLRLVGPGRVAVQSVYERDSDNGHVRRSSRATEQRWGNPLGAMATEYFS